MTSLLRYSIVLSLTIVGCGTGQESTKNVSEPSVAKDVSSRSVTESHQSKSSEKSAASADNSLTTNEYMDLGMPSPERRWMGSDLESAANVIENICQKDLSQLPRYHSAKSGEVFERIVNPENLNGLRDPSMPIEFRFREITKFMQAANTVNKAYMASLIKMSTGDDEMTDMTGLVLRVAVVMIGTIDEFLPTIDPNSPTYPSRMAGLKQYRSAMANMMLGSIKQISEPETWKVEPLRRFIGNMDETFPVMIASVPSSVGKEVMNQLNTLAKKPGLGANQQAFGEMVSKVTRAADNAPAKNSPWSEK